jgi:hypothetical protein
MRMAKNISDESRKLQSLILVLSPAFSCVYICTEVKILIYLNAIY